MSTRSIIRRWGLTITLVVLAAGVDIGSAIAAELRVLSAGAVKAVVPGLADAFHKETGHVVTLDFDTAGALRRRSSPASRLTCSSRPTR